MRDTQAIAEKTERLIRMTGEYCDEYLDEEYKVLCEKLIRKMSRKRPVPFLSGRIEIWAAAVVYALGSINYLFDKSTKPYASPADICDYFKTKKSTTSQKAKGIRDMFDLYFFDEEFSTSREDEEDLYEDLVLIDGVIVPKDMLPPELLKKLESDR
ncbi:DUF6398 domain-containing protein [Methanogenium cariaci]|jgi:uncharacterized protein DUF6398|uniref:DUF6398 domain-containing protein n=1 Tax=Methanogenium cariaci TaxID=2197 RepID=UPI0007843D04|nr:DUF6398 domain-containing protein [Methanogenium cariaci]